MPSSCWYPDRAPHPGLYLLHSALNYEPDCAAKPVMCFCHETCNGVSLVWRRLYDDFLDLYLSFPLLKISYNCRYWRRYSFHPSAFPRRLARPSRTDCAAESTAGCNSDNGLVQMDSWKYIVLDLSLNVNGMDTEGMMPNHMLTPLCCAARANCDIEDLVRFSLERNMDAYIN